MSGGCAVGEVVNKGGDALEAPAQEAEINFKLNLADRMLNFEAFRHYPYSQEQEDSSGLDRFRTINIQFVTLASPRWVLHHFFLDYFHHWLERGGGYCGPISLKILWSPPPETEGAIRK